MNRKTESKACTKQSTTVYLEQYSEPLGLNEVFGKPPRGKPTYPDIRSTILKAGQQNMTSGRVDTAGEMTRDVR